MPPPTRHFVLGGLLLAGGLGATLAMDGQVLWWGAIVAGLVELGRGVWLAGRARRSRSRE